MRLLTLAAFCIASAISFNATAQQQSKASDSLAIAQEDTLEAAGNGMGQEYKIVRSLKGAYLNSSCGTDRLGGSKIGFISEDIPLKVTEGNERLYKVFLSENRYAYIPKEMVADTTITDTLALATCASESVMVLNEGDHDRIKIRLPYRKPYIIRENSNPRQLVVELYGVQNNSNWMTQYLDLKVVENVEVIESDSDITTYIFNLKGASSWGYAVKYEKNNLTIDLKHAPEFTLKGMTIGVDAGHGGPESNGAIGRTTKAKEKDLNLAMAHILKRILESKGAKVVLSRSEDVGMTMNERKEKFLENNIDLMISIHCNAGGGAAHGTSTYYKHIQNRELAKTILEHLVEIDGVNCFGLIGNFNFSLNAPTEYPAVLVETLFLSHKWDEEQIVKPEFQQLMMKKVAAGIEDYLKECKKAEKRAAR